MNPGTTLNPAGRSSTPGFTGAAVDNTVPGNKQGEQEGVVVSRNGSGSSAPGGASAFAPSLARAKMDMVQALEILTMAIDASAKGRMQLEKTDTDLARTQLDEAHKRAKEKTEEMRAKQEEAKSKVVGETIARWLKVIAGLVGAIAGAVASAGAAAPLVAMAVVGVVMAVADMTNAAVQEAKVEVGAEGKKRPLEISFGGLVTALAQDLNTYPPGFSEKQKQDWIMGWTMAVNLTVAALGLAAGGYQLKQLFNSVEATKTVAQAATQVTETTVAAARQLSNTAQAIGAVVSSCADVVNGIGTVAEGGIRIDLAYTNLDTEVARADRSRYEAMGQLLMTRLRDNGDFTRQSLRVMNEAWTQLSDLIAETGRTQGKIARNI